MKPVQYYGICAQLTAHNLNPTLMHHINSVNTELMHPTCQKGIHSIKNKSTTQVSVCDTDVLLKYRVYTYQSPHCTSRHSPRLNMSPFAILMKAVKADEYNDDRSTDWYNKSKDQYNNKRWKKSGKVKGQKKATLYLSRRNKNTPSKKETERWREWCRGRRRRMSHFRVCGVSHSFLNTRQGNRPHTCTVQSLKLYSRARPRSAKTLKTFAGCAFHLRC